MMRFLGIDLGWSSGASGLCCLIWDGKQLHLSDLDHLLEIPSILHWIDNVTANQAPAAIAVDAPTIIPNETGMRLPDRLAHKYFGRYHAGCYPANLGRPFAQRTVEFGLSLAKRGFHHAPQIEPRVEGRYQMEIFPHPATIHLFGLDRILKYKKGRLRDRRSELAKLRAYILEHLPRLEPRLDLSPKAIPEIPLKGADVKAVEDRLDSLICAYVAAHWWYWGTERNWVLGNREEGYIVVPAPVSQNPAPQRDRSNRSTGLIEQ